MPASSDHPHLPALSAELLAFVAERHLATLTTLRDDGSPHVVPVGFTFDPLNGLVRVITRGGSVKARNAAAGRRAAVSQVDAGRWVTFEGVSRVSADPDDVATAVRMYAERYRPPPPREDRVAIEIVVDKVMGRA